MRFTGYSFGSIRVDGVTYDHDLVIDRGKIRKRKKTASRKFRSGYGHTPLSAAEDIRWRCRRLALFYLLSIWSWLWDGVPLCQGRTWPNRTSSP